MKYIFAIIISFLFFFGCSKHSDVVTLKSGLKYKDDVLGKGKEAKMGKLVSVHFQGWYVGDSSKLFSDWSKDPDMKKYSIGDSRIYKRPIKFVLGTKAFIKGIDEGIAGMKEGGTRSIIIPPNLGYGNRQYGPIPANSKLKIVIELLTVKDPIIAKEWDVDSTKLIKTKSGLKYYILKQGTGDFIKPGDTVEVHYSGFLTDGTKFGSSVERDEPFRFIVGQKRVIPGWEEAILLLKKGAKARLVIPPSLAYGNRQMSTIPPNSTLIYDIQVLDVKK